MNSSDEAALHTGHLYFEWRRADARLREADGNLRATAAQLQQAQARVAELEKGTASSAAGSVLCGFCTTPVVVPAGTTSGEALRAHVATCAASPAVELEAEVARLVRELFDIAWPAGRIGGEKVADALERIRELRSDLLEADSERANAVRAHEQLQAQVDELPARVAAAVNDERLAIAETARGLAQSCVLGSHFGTAEGWSEFAKRLEEGPPDPEVPREVDFTLAAGELRQAAEAPPALDANGSEVAP